MPESTDPGHIERTVLATIAEEMRLKPEKVTPESRLREDLGAGSLNLIEIAFALEERVDVELPAEAEETVKTVGDVVKMVVDAASKKNP